MAGERGRGPFGRYTAFLLGLHCFLQIKNSLPGLIPSVYALRSTRARGNLPFRRDFPVQQSRLAEPLVDTRLHGCFCLIQCLGGLEVVANRAVAAGNHPFPSRLIVMLQDIGQLMLTEHTGKGAISDRFPC